MTRSKKSILRKIVEAKTPAQKRVFEMFEKYHLILNGSAGSGKTYISTYLALKHLESSYNLEKLVFIRPLVQSHDIGFLPGGVDMGADGGKMEPFAATYKYIVDDLCGKGTWDTKYGHKFEFHSTSFLRGTTFDNCIVLVDEMQNCDYDSLRTIATRLGEYSKLIMCGDYFQSDLKKHMDKQGILKFLDVIDSMKYFKEVKFNRNDIVRSDFVRDFIIAEEDYNSGS